MIYQLTVEQCRRIAIYIEAESDQEAEERMDERLAALTDEDFNDCDKERDYSLTDELGRTIIDWD